jgi:hypothetical protein
VTAGLAVSHGTALTGVGTTMTMLVALPVTVLAVAVAVALIAGVFAPSRQRYARDLLREILRAERLRPRAPRRQRRDDVGR